MTSLRGRAWTNFMLEAEIESFGTTRIVDEHNAVLYQLRRLEELLASTNALYVRTEFKQFEDNVNALDEASGYIARQSWQ